MTYPLNSFSFKLAAQLAMGQAAGRLDGMQETTFNAGLKVRLSQPGLNYGAAIAVDVLVTRLHGIYISDQIGRCHIPVVGLVDYEIRHVQVNSKNVLSYSLRHIVLHVTQSLNALHT